MLPLGLDGLLGTTPCRYRVRVPARMTGYPTVADQKCHSTLLSEVCEMMLTRGYTPHEPIPSDLTVFGTCMDLCR